MSSYIKGRRLEYRVRDLFKDKGFIVIRAARSAPVDLVCLKNGDSLLIECKANKSEFGKKNREELLKMAKKAGAKPILAYRDKRKIFLIDVWKNSHVSIDEQ
ncbi:MAG: restriction endonuclease [Candidatus Bathyarchaeota archaeon]|nr:restriction endonuclease [Candidatus Bathyarchaeota archaeon]